jgi:hypothetical protein
MHRHIVLGEIAESRALGHAEFAQPIAFEECAAPRILADAIFDGHWLARNIESHLFPLNIS